MSGQLQAPATGDQKPALRSGQQVREAWHTHPLWFLIGGAFLVFVCLSLLILPFFGTPPVWGSQDRIAITTDDPAARAALLQARAALLQVQVQASAVLVQLIGGAILLFTVYTAFMTAQQTQKSLEVSREQLRIAQEGQITERFTRAIELLGATHEDGAPQLEVRLGGIYALERIAQDSERDYWPIMKALATYVREHARVPEEKVDQELPSRDSVSVDIKATLDVFCQRTEKQRAWDADRWLDLSRADLRGAVLNHGHLERVRLRRTHLEGASLVETHLEGAQFDGAHLEGALLWETHLEGAHFGGAHLERASFWDTHLEGASLGSAHLQGAHFGLVHLKGASLGGAHLEGVDFSQATGLTQAQIDETYMDNHTRLPAGPGPDGQPYRRSTRVPPKKKPSVNNSGGDV